MQKRDGERRVTLMLWWVSNTAAYPWAFRENAAEARKGNTLACLVPFARSQAAMMTV
jgi:hypothetical protein